MRDVFQNHLTQALVYALMSVGLEREQGQEGEQKEEMEMNAALGSSSPSVFNTFGGCLLDLSLLCHVKIKLWYTSIVYCISYGMVLYDGDTAARSHTFQQLTCVHVAVWFRYSSDCPFILF